MKFEKQFNRTAGSTAVFSLRKFLLSHHDRLALKKIKDSCVSTLLLDYLKKTPKTVNK